MLKSGFKGSIAVGALIAACFSVVVSAMLRGAAADQAPQHGSLWSPSAEYVALQRTKKAFTVADSIAMTHFVDPEENYPRAQPKFSPDNRRFFVVTEHGILRSNLREYALMMYESALKTKPVTAAIMRTSSNRPGIFSAKWINNKTVAFIGENPGQYPQLYAVDLQARRLRQLTFAKMGVANSPFDASTDLRTIVYSAPTSNLPETRYKEQHGFAVTYETLGDLISGRWKVPQGIYQTFILNTVSGRTVAVKGGPFQWKDHRLAVWLSPNGRFAVVEEPAFRIPPSWEGYGYWWLSQQARTMQAGYSRLASSNALGQAMIVDTNTGKVWPMANAPEAKWRFTAEWSPDSRSVFVAGTYMPLDHLDSKGELVRRARFPVLGVYDVRRRSFSRITDMPDDQMWTFDGTATSARVPLSVLGVTNLDNFVTMPRIAFQRTAGTWTRATFGTTAGSGHPDIEISNGLNEWPKLIKIDERTGRSKIITDPNPQFRKLSLGHEEVIHWTGKYGEPLIGGLVYPANYRPDIRYPLVIQTHGFDEHLFLPDGPYTSALAAQELANRGIAVVQFGDTPLNEKAEPTLQEGPVNISPYESVIDYLSAQGIIDSKRVGLNGFSVTGFHVKYALAFSKYKFLAATATEGNDNGYFTYVVFGSHPGVANQWEMKYGGAPWSGNLKAWTDNSISFNYDRIHTPLRLESDSNPGEVLNEWEPFVALRRLQKPVELIFVSHGDHPVVKPWDRMASQQGNVDWFDFWLNGREDPAPGKRDEYARWHELRKLRDADKRRALK